VQGIIAVANVFREKIRSRSQHPSRTIRSIPWHFR